ncbi:shikimate dehydrogenase [bacterium]|nr:shikimate dehydrogenase [bacterium]
MYKLGLIGYPLSHSISAIIQKAGFESIKEEGTYEIMETPPEELINTVKYLKTNNYNGFNVTIPLKVPISLFLDEIDETANITGCANTIKILPDKSFKGYNTDIYGFWSALPKDISLTDKKAGIIGTGGAARAATIGLIQAGIKEINYYSRNVINSTEMINYMRKTFPEIKFNNYQIQIMQGLTEISILVNCTPIGMLGHSMNEMPISEKNLSRINKDAIIYDVIYNPTETLLLNKAQEMGFVTVNGLDMLINQGAKALEIWTDKKPDTQVMKIKALQTLK